MRAVSQYWSKFFYKNDLVKHVFTKPSPFKYLNDMMPKNEGNEQIQQNKSIRVVRANQSNLDTVLSIMKDHYFPDEPVTSVLDLKPKLNDIIDEHVMLSMREGGTLIAVENDVIIGSIINRTSCIWDANLLENFAERKQCQNTMNWLKFTAMIQRAPQIYDCFDVAKVWEMTMLTVAREHRNKGVGTMLVKASLDFGRDLGYRIARIDCTNEATCRIALEAQMECIHRYPYNCYKDRFGTDVLNMLGPLNTHLKVYVDNLRKLSVHDRNWLMNVKSVSSSAPNVILHQDPTINIPDVAIHEDLPITKSFAERHREAEIDIATDTSKVQELAENVKESKHLTGTKTGTAL